MKTLSITRALAEVKLLDKRITSATEKINPLKISYTKLVNSDLITQQKKFIADATANYQTAIALIERRDAIKEAIVISNATTIVNVAGKDYTVAAAIETKASIAHKKRLANHFRECARLAANQLERESETYQQRLDNFLSGQAVALGKNRGDVAWVQEQTQSYSQLHEPILLDPLNLGELVATLKDEVEQFEAEVDYCLSESNAKTTIEVAD